MPHKTYRDLSELRPYVRVRAEEWLARCKEVGLDPRISETYRSNKRQEYLYAQKLSTVKTTGAHGFRVALDYFFIENGKAVYPVAKMTAAAQIAKSLGFEWGGDWKSFKDMPHLQMLGGVTLAQYRQGKRPFWYDFEIDSLKTPESIIDPDEPEEEEMRPEEFERMFDEMMRRRAQLPPSTWAIEAWDAVSKTPSVGDPNLMVMNGENAHGYITREQYAATLARLGIINPSQQ